MCQLLQTYLRRQSEIVTTTLTWSERAFRRKEKKGVTLLAVIMKFNFQC